MWTRMLQVSQAWRGKAGLTSQEATRSVVFTMVVSSHSARLINRLTTLIMFTRSRWATSMLTLPQETWLFSHHFLNKVLKKICSPTMRSYMSILKCQARISSSSQSMRVLSSGWSRQTTIHLALKSEAPVITRLSTLEAASWTLSPRTLSRCKTKPTCDLRLLLQNHVRRAQAKGTSWFRTSHLSQATHLTSVETKQVLHQLITRMLTLASSYATKSTS